MNGRDPEPRLDVDLLAEISDDPFNEESDYGRGFAAGKRADAVTLGVVTDVRAMASLALIGAGSNRDLQNFALDIINRLRGL